MNLPPSSRELLQLFPVCKQKRDDETVPRKPPNQGPGPRGQLPADDYSSSSSQRREPERAKLTARSDDEQTQTEAGTAG
jgi:hypothetical protein